MQETSSSLTARTSFRTAAKSRRPWLEEALAAEAPRLLPPTHPECRLNQMLLPPPSLLARSLEPPGDESVSAVYSAAGRHYAAHGGRPPGRICGLPSASGFRTSASRLPNDSNPDLLSGCQPRRSGLLGHSSA